MLEEALTTTELRLRLPVAPVDIATPTAPLRGVARVDGRNATTNGFSLVFKEASQLCEAPRVESTFGFSAPGFASSSYVREILDNDCCSGFDISNDGARYNVVAIPSKTLFASSKASKMPLGRLRTVVLQCTFEANGSLDDFIPVAFAVESVIGSNGRAGNAQIDSERRAFLDKLNAGEFDSDMQIESALTANEIGCGGRKADGVPGTPRNIEWNLESARSCGHRDNALIPVGFERMLVISRSTRQRMWTTYFVPLLLMGYRRLRGFCRPLPSLYMEIRNKIRQGILAIAVGQSVKRVGVAGVLFPPHAADRIERFRELAYRFQECLALLRGGVESQPDRSVHEDIIPYKPEQLQTGKGDAVNLLSGRIRNFCLLQI
jgi:hypothetical protein